jgi:hypothetical protein
MIPWEEYLCIHVCIELTPLYSQPSLKTHSGGEEEKRKEKKDSTP